MAILTNKQFVAVGVVAVLGALYVKRKAGQAAEALNPVNPDNIINQQVVAVVGQDRLTTLGDLVFGGAELLNPFDTDDAGDQMGRDAWGALFNGID